MHVAKKILGVEEQNLSGSGVTIAFIDTGIEKHCDFCLGGYLVEIHLKLSKILFILLYSFSLRLPLMLSTIFDRALKSKVPEAFWLHKNIKILNEYLFINSFRVLADRHQLEQRD